MQKWNFRETDLPLRCKSILHGEEYGYANISLIDLSRGLRTHLQFTVNIDSHYSISIRFCYSLRMILERRYLEEKIFIMRITSRAILTLPIK